MSFLKPTLSGEFIHKTDLLAQQYESLLEAFNESDDVIKAGRNTLKKVSFKGTVCVVKAFRIPTFAQNYGYGLFAKSKARKSYDNAQRLLDLGFSTPAPIGFYEWKFRGKLTTSYYICDYADNVKTLDELWDSTKMDAELIQEFAKYCSQLHAKGVLHRDFNPKNILVSQDNGKREFSLVDINRITWYNKLSLKKSMQSLSRLPFSEEDRALMLESYATSSKADLSHCHALLKKSELKTQRYFRNKRQLRKIFPKK